MPDVRMPRLSDSMEEATIVSWQVADGDHVKPGQEIAEVETDKAIVPLEAESEGTIELVVQAGETVPLGAVIARIGLTGEQAGADTQGNGSSTGETAPDAHAVLVAGAPSAAKASADDGSLDLATAVRPPASPSARRLAHSLGVDLHQLTGSGPRRRILRGDVERAARERTGDGVASAAHSDARAPAGAGASTPGDPGATLPATLQTPPRAKGETTLIELSRTQQVIARRMAESRATVPDFDLTVDVDMEAAWTLRQELKRLAGDDGMVVPSLNDIVVMACGRALREQPKVNGSYRDGQVELFSRVNVGMAIATPDSLVVATVFDADQQSLGSIARTTRRLAERVRDGSITPPELGGATFTVSNLGMFGVDRFSAVVNPPQAAILAVGAVRPRAVAHEGELSVRRCMTMTLSSDHRTLYGADAARFLTRVRELLEHPVAGLVG